MFARINLANLFGNQEHLPKLSNMVVGYYWKILIKHHRMLFQLYWHYSNQKNLPSQDTVEQFLSKKAFKYLQQKGNFCVTAMNTTSHITITSTILVHEFYLYHKIFKLNIIAMIHNLHFYFNWQRSSATEEFYF